MNKLTVTLVAAVLGTASVGAFAQAAGKGTTRDGSSYEKQLEMAGMSGLSGMSGNRSSTAEPKKEEKKVAKKAKKAEKKAEEKKAAN